MDDFDKVLLFLHLLSVVVGIGGSDLGGRVIHELLDHPYHNELPPEERGNLPACALPRCGKRGERLEYRSLPTRSFERCGNAQKEFSCDSDANPRR